MHAANGRSEEKLGPSLSLNRQSFHRGSARTKNFDGILKGTGWCPRSESRSVGEHNSNFTRSYGRYMELVNGIINQLVTGGAPSCSYVELPEETHHFHVANLPGVCWSVRRRAAAAIASLAPPWHRNALFGCFQVVTCGENRILWRFVEHIWQIGSHESHQTLSNIFRKTKIVKQHDKKNIEKLTWLKFH